MLFFSFFVCSASYAQDYFLLTDNTGPTILSQDDAADGTGTDYIGIGNATPRSNFVVSKYLSDLDGSQPYSVGEISNFSYSIYRSEHGTDVPVKQEPYSQYSFVVNRHALQNILGGKRTVTELTDMVVDQNGNTGIGTATPATRLHVYGAANGGYDLLQVANDAGPAMYVTAGGYTGVGTSTPLANFDVRGKAMIGNGQRPHVNPFSNYTLAVNGLIVSKEVIVETNDWADKVFDKSYNLKSLSEVEEYIYQYKHLPEIPTECEAIENGVNVGEMNKLLLQKIEELTLYILALQKDNNNIKDELKEIKK